MSLTSFIEANRGVWAEHVRRPGVRPELANRVERRSDPRWMGCAFDYAMRFGMRARWPELALTRRLLSERARWNAAKFALDFEAMDRRLSDAEACLRNLSPGSFSGEQARAALILGRSEVFARGRGSEELFVQLMGDPSAAQVEELLELYELITWEALDPSQVLALNPTFNEGSSLVGGADADLVIDDLVIDIKTVAKPKLEARDIRQVVGYALLANRFGISGVERAPRITRLGIWLSRSGELVCFDLEEVCSPGSQAALLEAMTVRA
jgi:hypothetical protein